MFIFLERQIYNYVVIFNPYNTAKNPNSFFNQTQYSVSKDFNQDYVFKGL